MKKLVYVFMFVFVFFLGGIYSFNKTKNQSQTKGVSSQTIIVYQSIFIKNSDKSVPIKLNIENGKTALDLLRKTAVVKTQGSGRNTFVLEINNIKAENSQKEYWAFYVNSKIAAVGAGSYLLKMGDKIEWKIENY